MAVVLRAFVGVALKRLSAFLEEKASMMLGVKDELNKLLRKLQRLTIYLEDAESKSIQDPFIGSWLGELKDFMYDADDIIDICRIEGTKLLEGHQPSTSTQSVRSCFPLMSCFSGTKFRYEIAEQIKKLNERLKEIEDNKPARLEVNNTMRSHSFNNRQTSPEMAESDYVGEDIEKATQCLVTSLIEESESRTKCRVWGIVGMGGIGKTTLASKVYNHPLTVSHFTVRIWVCISQTFSETDILKQIIRGAKGVCGEASSKAELHSLLISSLSSKFLIVLDDVWSTDIWEDSLRSPLEKCGAPSGKVVVTTRDLGIAKSMRATIHHVEKMNNNDGWMLLCKKAFRDDDGKEDMLGLKDIGLQIVEKCDGLPLAIKAIAGILRSNDTSRKEWEKLLRNHAWSMDQLPKELRGALYLSYVDLPSYLKQCFLYFSLSPEDSHILKEDLVHCWVAEGFIREDEDDVLMEDIAEDYCNQLIRRNLLQYTETGACRIHDLLRSLAQFLIGGENICIDNDAAERNLLNANGLRSVRRLSLSKMTTSFFDSIKESTRGLRSLLWNHRYGTLPSDMRALMEGDVLVKNLQCLRVLHLSRSGIERLPNSVGKLVHLRYLNLNNTSIDELPESIGNLVNLQVLCLLGCKNLFFLPNGITQLSNLRHLDFSVTPLVCLPKGFGQLKQLNRLKGFVVGDVDSLSKACQIEELQPLSKLRILSIHKLERVRVTTGTSLLTNKQLLKGLTLSFSGEHVFEYGETEVKITENVMEELCPPSNLEELHIYYYPGCRFPHWMSNGFSHLEGVKLDDCKSCTQLPPLGQLPQLKRLEISGADSIVSVGPEFFFGGTTGTGEGAFPKLEDLDFWDMPEWEEMVLEYDECVHRGKLLPRLKKVRFSKCPKLRSLPSGLQHATSLQSLTIIDADYIQEVKDLPSLTELVIYGCSCLREIQHLPLLQTLNIDKCPQLIRVSYVDSLQTLNIYRCPQLTRVSDVDSLQTLYIDRCPQLTRVSDVDSLQKLRLRLDKETERLPNWLLELALERQQRNVKPDFEFHLHCSSIQLQRCREGGEYWPIINQFPRVHITTTDGKESLTIINVIQVSDVV